MGRRRKEEKRENYLLEMARVGHRKIGAQLLYQLVDFGDIETKTKCKHIRDEAAE